MITNAFLINKIDQLLRELKILQTNEGSFETYYRQPFYHPEKGWMKWPKNSSFDVASILLPLLRINSDIAEEILFDGVLFLKKDSFLNRLWSFPRGNGYVFPYDSESTSLSSYVVYKVTKRHPRNKFLLNTLINKRGYYYLFITPKNRRKLLPCLLYKHIISSSDKKLGISWRDSEFATSCNNLLYVGEMKRNQQTWFRIFEDVKNKDVETIYYDLSYSLYTYARLYYYENHDYLSNNKNKVEEYLSENLSDILLEDFSLKYLFISNVVLMLEIDKTIEIEILFERCFSILKTQKYFELLEYYNSNSICDIDQHTNTPNTLFTAKGINHALLIEFLNLYKIRYFEKQSI